MIFQHPAYTLLEHFDRFLPHNIGLYFTKIFPNSLTVKLQQQLVQLKLVTCKGIQSSIPIINETHITGYVLVVLFTINVQVRFNKKNLTKCNVKHYVMFSYFTMPGLECLGAKYMSHRQ